MATSADEHTEASASDTWSLPVNLLSHHSPFFRAACLGDFQEGRRRLIELPEDDPAVFGLFVEWMYYGSYDALPLTTHSGIDAKCWVLGDKLLCSEFKNYAMSLLYARHITAVFSRAMTSKDVQYACDASAPGSKLRQFYVDSVLEYFGRPSKLHGTIEDWDELLQREPALRLLLLQTLRQGLPARTHIRQIKDYLDWDEPDLLHPLRREAGVSRSAVGGREDDARDLDFESKAEEEEEEPTTALE